MVKNLRQWKTTLIGFILLGTLVLYVYNGGESWTMGLLLLGGGVSMLFAPDSLVTGIKKVIKNLPKLMENNE